MPSPSRSPLGNQVADIIVTGYMARHPLAGNMLAYFQYVLGFARLGHDVMYLEEPGWPYSAYDPRTGECSDFPEEGLRRARALVHQFCPGVPVVFADPLSRRIDGATWVELRDRIGRCDLLLDVGGVCWLDEFELASRRAVVDLDPLFTQVGGPDGFAHERLDAYDVHFTYGGNIGRRGCPIPTGGYEWIATPPPVVPDLWNELPPPSTPRFTTVANWDAYRATEYGGQRFGQKSEEFVRLASLPELVSATLEIAVSGDIAPAMRNGGWQVTSAAWVSDTVDRYRDYIAGSLAEISAAKHAYVASRSGWFSDRSASYMAAGRPVVLQDTGFDAWLPTGEGLLTFTDVHEAAAAVQAVLADPARHAAAARAVVAGHLAADVVLPRLLTAAGCAREAPC